MQKILKNMRVSKYFSLLASTLSSSSSYLIYLTKMCAYVVVAIVDAEVTC